MGKHPLGEQTFPLRLQPPCQVNSLWLRDRSQGQMGGHTACSQAHLSHTPHRWNFLNACSELWQCACQTLPLFRIVIPKQHCHQAQGPQRLNAAFEHSFKFSNIFTYSLQIHHTEKNAALEFFHAAWTIPRNDEYFYIICCFEASWGISSLCSDIMASCN